MMQPILVFLAVICIAISTIALYYFLIRSFFIKPGNKEKTTEKGKILKEKMRLFLFATITSELLGLFFLILADSIKGPILTIHGFALLLASCFCSFLTLYNAVSLEEIDLLVREGLQFGTLLFSLVLIKISLTLPEGFDIESFHGTLFVFVSFFSVIYFATSVLGVALILWDAMKIEVEYITRYLILVIIVGVLVGSGLMFLSNYWTSFF